MQISKPEQYWATFEGSEFLDALKNQVTTYRNFCVSNGLRSLWANSMGAKYGVSSDGKVSWKVSPGGEFGELVQLKVNDYASLVKHQVVLAIQNRPAGIAKAVNTDVKTLRNARIGSQLVENYLSSPEYEFENDYVQALTLALLTAEACVVQDWNTSLGPEVRPDEQEVMLHAGDIEQAVFPTWNAARDLGIPNPEKAPWWIFSDRVNKFDLAAKYKAYSEAILLDGTSSGQIAEPILFRLGTDSTDYIELHRLIHFPTPALPQGRYALFINDQVIMDVPYPYTKRNVHRISDEELFSTAFGHTSNYDLLSLEQVTDTLHSIAVTNITTFGVNTIVGPKGGGVAHQELAAGLRYIEVDPQYVDKIKPLQLASTPREVFEYNAALGVKKGELSGINSILRGDPQGQLKGSSGAAMALLQSQAIAYNSGTQRAFYRLLNSCGTGIIQLCQQFAGEERIVKVAGKANAQAIKEFKFSGETLGAVSTVVFEAVNPVLQTTSGKLTIADNLLQAGLITNPRRYIEVLTTGNLNILLEDEVAVEESIIEENELLSEGQPVQAVLTENHKQHIMGHQAVISKPNAKLDAALVETTLAHIQEHTNLWVQLSMQNPALLIATGQEVLPVGAMGGMMPPQQGAPGGGEPPAGPDAGQPSQPNLPKPPNDPSTGEPAPVAPGTSVSAA